CAAILAGLPTALARLTPLRPYSPSWIRPKDGSAVVLGLFLVLLTAVLSPELHPGRVSRNECAVISDLRTVIAAQTAYREVNGGLFDSRLICLVRPAQCIPGVNIDHKGFLSEELTAQTRFGYNRILTPGPAPNVMPPNVSKTSVTTYSVTAGPVSRG